MPLSVSVCIANYKQDKFLSEALDSISMQDYKDIEVCIYDDKEGVGSGEAFNQAIAKAKGDIIILLCADDVFTDTHVISDIAKIFETFPGMLHVTRFYHQFVDGDRSPVRAWRNKNPLELSNNPSGLAFRREGIEGLKLTNKMFIEAPYLVKQVLDKRNWFSVLEYDTVGVRIHKSTARSPEYYKKMWTSSPVEEWAKLGWRSNDFTSLIQIANYFTRAAVISEIGIFISTNRKNLFNPALYFFGVAALFTPKVILLKIPEIYRSTWGRWFTREIKRQDYGRNSST